MTDTPSERRAFRNYAHGVITAARFIAEGHGEDSIAAEMLTRLLDGETVGWMRRLAKAEEVQFKRGFWKEVDRWANR